jgi:hypothetical protein
MAVEAGVGGMLVAVGGWGVSVGGGIKVGVGEDCGAQAAITSKIPHTVRRTALCCMA